jgi:glycosyltransferase involved in cell wall biosynthesis
LRRGSGLSVQIVRKFVNKYILILICYIHDDDNTLPVVETARNDLRFEMVLVKNRKTGAHGAVSTDIYFSSAPAVLVFVADDQVNARIINKCMKCSSKDYDKHQP